MVKETLTVLFFASAILACGSPERRPATAGAANAVDTADISSPWSQAPDLIESKRAWSKESGGLVVDLDISRDGSTVLASTTPDYDSDTGVKKHLILSLGRLGKLNFKKIATAPVKAQALSFDGQFSFVSTYDDSLTAYNKSGKQLWRVDSVCKPLALNRLKRVICYHDDDAEPKTAFEILDWRTGLKLDSHRITSDVLALKVAPDENSFVLALSDGWIEFFGPDLKLKWRKKLELGNRFKTIDLAVSAGKTPRVSVLLGASSPGPEEKIVLMGENGETLSEVKPSMHVEQVEILPDSSSVIAYGNGRSGQSVLSFSTPKLLETWRVHDPEPAQYNAILTGGGPLAVVRYEGSGPKASNKEILAFDKNAKVHQLFPLQFGEGIALYAWSIGNSGAQGTRGHPSPRGSLVLATEDGKIEYFR